jgi:hypothetical protein
MKKIANELVGFRLPPELIARTRAEALRRDLPVSTVVREALELGVPVPRSVRVTVDPKELAKRAGRE